VGDRQVDGDNEPGARVLTPLERVEEMMAAYGMTYNEVGGLPASRFEQLWKAYAIRTSLDKLDREYDRQRTTVQSSMGEPEKIKEALEDLHHAYLAQRDEIASGRAFEAQEERLEDEIWWPR